MTPQNEFDRRLGAWMTDTVSSPPPAGRFEAAMEATRRRRPRPRWLARFGSDWVGSSAPKRFEWAWTDGRRDLTMAAALGLLLAAAIGGALLIGAQLLRSEPRPWHLGDLAYSLDGDIYMASAGGESPVRLASGTPDSTTGSRQAGDPHWSPDGRYLMYQDAAVVRVIDRQDREVASFPGRYSTWSPDSTRIATWGSLPDLVDIRAIDGSLESSVVVPDTLQASGAQRPGWSADGRDIVLPHYFLVAQGEGHARSWMLPVDGGAWRQLSDITTGYRPAFSPNGAKIAVDADDGLYMTPPDFSYPDLLGKPSDGSYRGPMWSPAGDKIAVEWWRSDGRRSVDVLVDFGAPLVTVLGPLDGDASLLDWSPDGSSLLVGVRGADSIGSLWSVPVDGSGGHVLVEGADDGDWRSVPPDLLPAAGTLEPGTYAIPKTPGRNSDYVKVIVTLPAGWATTDGLVHKHLGQLGEVAFSTWAVSEVYADPCHWKTSALSPIEHTHAPDGRYVPKGGLATQKMRGPTLRVLTDTQVGAEVAVRIDLSVPVDLDLSACDEGEFRSWTEGSRPNAHHRPGQLDSVYMFDLDRGPLLIDVSHMPGTTAEDLAELEAVIASMTIDRGY